MELYKDQYQKLEVFNPLKNDNYLLRITDRDQFMSLVTTKQDLLEIAEKIKHFVEKE